MINCEIKRLKLFCLFPIKSWKYQQTALNKKNMLIKNLICPVIKLHSSDLIYERLNNNTNSNHLWSDPNRARRMASLTRYKELETASPALNPFVSPSITFEYFQRLNVPPIHLIQWPIILAINWGWTKMSAILHLTVFAIEFEVFRFALLILDGEGANLFDILIYAVYIKLYLVIVLSCNTSTSCYSIIISSPVILFSNLSSLVAQGAPLTWADRNV